MMLKHKFKIIIFTFFAVLTLNTCSSFIHSNSIALDTVLPKDKDILRGQLDNGFTYYLKHNARPENRVTIHLVLNAGSVLENDNQKGVAHLIEHMAFNGTKHFPKDSLINYLESTGIRFGAEINAHTGFDETVFKLQFPADDPELIQTGFQVFEDWASNISFDRDEIEKEKLVVLEEMRQGRGAAARIRDKHLPVLFKDSQYASRLPIGKRETLVNARYEDVIKFYSDWYRPDLMAIIIVGDFETESMMGLIKKHFSGLKTPENAPERIYYSAPDHQETLFAIASDAEETQSSISLNIKFPVLDEITVGDYREKLVRRMVYGMINARIREISRKADSPFLNSGLGFYRYVRTVNIFSVNTKVKDNGIEDGFAASLREIERARQFGFTESELQRMKDIFLQSMSRGIAEKDKTPSVSYVNEFKRNFLEDEPIPGIEYEFEIYQKYIPEVSLDMVNEVAKSLLIDKNRVVLVSLPDKENIQIPEEENLRKILEASQNEILTAYEDNMSTKPFFDKKVRPGRIWDEKYYSTLDVTRLQFENGMTVYLKATDFQNDQIVISGYSQGGYSLAGDDILETAKLTSMIISNNGVSEFNRTDLRKKLAGKTVNITPSISVNSEGFSGSSSASDAETMFQMLHLYFTEPRLDDNAFETFKNQVRDYLTNRLSSPKTVFDDSLQLILTSHHPRRQILNTGTLESIDDSLALIFYKERFADAGDFTFYIAGNFDLDNMKELLALYLGSLPGLDSNEHFRDENISTPKGLIKKTIYKGLEEKGKTRIILHGDFDWNLQNVHNMQSMTQVLNIILRERIREDLGGTYGVGVWASLEHFPTSQYKVNIAFDSDPERIEELSAAILDVIEDVKHNEVEDIYIQKVNKGNLSSRETQSKTNRFWVDKLKSYSVHGFGIENIPAYEELTKNFTRETMLDFSKQYLTTDNMIQISLYPETGKTE